jgi:magnesium transporter
VGDAGTRGERATATGEVPQASSRATAGEVRQGLIGRSYASVADVVVVDDGRLAGLVPIERLLAAAAATPLADLADPAPVVVAPGADREAATVELVRGHGRTLAVVDADGRFHGVLPPEALLHDLLDEHEEDLARLGGFLAGTSSARAASQERVSRRLWHRVPWLLLGLLGAMASAAIVASFEEQLEAQVLLAFFVPAIVYMADAVGTQTEAVVIRGISVGVSLRSIVWRELASGLIIGLLVAAAFLPFTYGIWGNASVAATVSLALFASSSIAVGVAMSLPYLLARLGLDPAYGSGPLATVIQDLLSIAVYLSIAVWLT